MILSEGMLKLVKVRLIINLHKKYMLYFIIGFGYSNVFVMNNEVLYGAQKWCLQTVFIPIIVIYITFFIGIL